MGRLSRLMYVFVLIVLLVLPSITLAGGSVVFDGRAVENPRVIVHIYSNKTLHVVVVGGVNESVMQSEWVYVYGNGTVRVVYRDLWFGENLGVRGYVRRGVFGDGKFVEDVDMSMLTDTEKVVANTTVDIVFDESKGKIVVSGQGVARYYDLATGELKKEEKLEDSYELDKFVQWDDVVNKVFVDTLRGVGGLRVDSYVLKYRVNDTSESHCEEYVIVGDPVEYFELYAKVYGNRSTLGGFVDRFMDKMVVPNVLGYKWGFDEVRIMLPMIKWYDGVLGDVAGFFMDNYNLSSDTPVVIVAGEGVSVSATETTLGELGEVKVVFETTTTTTTVETTSAMEQTTTTEQAGETTTGQEGVGTATATSQGVSGSGQAGGEANMLLYGVVGVVVVLVIVVLVLVMRKK
ncbi:MAG: hypothetical protein J7L82_00950 [Staphylothermus sp.]|nr:hypothetical protein [Staphylothermus sp.]